jgi:hypothetical protein
LTAELARIKAEQAEKDARAAEIARQQAAAQPTPLAGQGQGGGQPAPGQQQQEAA